MLISVSSKEQVPSIQNRSSGLTLAVCISLAYALPSLIGANQIAAQTLDTQLSIERVEPKQAEEKSAEKADKPALVKPKESEAEIKPLPKPVLKSAQDMERPDEVIIYSNQSFKSNAPKAADEEKGEIDPVKEANRYGINVIMLEEAPPKTTPNKAATPVKPDNSVKPSEPEKPAPSASTLQGAMIIKPIENPKPRSSNEVPEVLQSIWNWMGEKAQSVKSAISKEDQKQTKPAQPATNSEPNK